jgi:hypothetical protein
LESKEAPAAHLVEEPLHSNQAADGRLASASLSGSFAAVIPCWEPSEFLLEPANLDLERQNTLENSIPEKL